MGVNTVSFTCLVVGVMCMNAPFASAWGAYFCDLKEQGLQKIGEVCSQSYSSTGAPLTRLEEKLEKVLEFMEEIKTVEDSWFHLTKKSGTVERDLSQHEEETLKDQIRDRKDGRGDDEKRGDKEEEEEEDRSSRQKTEEEKDRSEDDHRATRAEYDYTQSRRNRTYGEERRGRGDDRRERGDDRRESRYDWQERRNNRYDERNRRERTTEEREESREESVRGVKREDDATGIKKGECEALVMDNHQTIGMFYMMSYQHGHCANRNPIREPVRYCLGYCTTKTFIEREAGIWSQGNDCNSCQPNSFETIRIPLSCDDGFTFEKKFQNVVDCSCRRCQAIIKDS